jgi:hypothetical protein
MRWVTTRRWYECRMQRRHRAAVAATCLALLFPAAALAGSAGDNQYQDPLGNTPSQPKSTTQQATTPAPPPAPTPSATSQPTATTAQTTTRSSGQLPRTGLPLGPLVALGAGLIAAGLLIRRLA